MLSLPAVVLFCATFSGAALSSFFLRKKVGEINRKLSDSEQISYRGMHPARQIFRCTMFAFAVLRHCIDSSSFFKVLARILQRRQQKTEFQRRVEAIDWSQYQTAYGLAVTVPAQLTRLASEDIEEARSASHDLWCGLCHQHVMVGSAALPALPFLLEVMDRANDLLVVEILDILLGFAICTNPIRIAEFYAHPLVNEPVPTVPWIGNVREALLAELPRFRALESAHDEDVASFAKQILTELA